MKTSINLATHPYENLRPLYSGAVIAAVFLVLLSLILVWNVRQNRDENRSLIERNGQIEKQMADLRSEERQLDLWLARPEVQEIRERSAFLNGIIVRKSLSWTRMFMDFEKIIPDRVQVTAIRHSQNQSQQAELRLTVGSAAVQPLVDLLKRLEMSPLFGTPMVDSERYPAEKSTDPNILLELLVQYHQIPGVEALPQEVANATTEPLRASPELPEQPKLNPLPQQAAAPIPRLPATPPAQPAASPAAPPPVPTVAQPALPAATPAPGPGPAVARPPLAGPSSVPRPPDPPKGGN